MIALYLIVAIIAVVLWVAISFWMIPGWTAIWFYIRKFLIKSEKFEKDVNDYLEEIKNDEEERF